jgi:hypothetical protein
MVQTMLEVKSAKIAKQGENPSTRVKEKSLFNQKTVFNL